MITYAIIDRNSGFLWGVTEADTPESACCQIDNDIDTERRSIEDYQDVYSGDNWTYAVYAVEPGKYDDADGQDQAVIDEITAQRQIAYIERAA